MRGRYRNVMLATGVLGLLATGCGGDDGGSSPATTTASTEPAGAPGDDSAATTDPGQASDDSADAPSAPTTAPPSSEPATGDRPLIAATTTIWADVTRNVVCDDLAEVVAVIPPGADAHQYEPSLQDRGVLGDAALVVANGLFLEESLVATLDAVERDGVPVFQVADHIGEPIEFGDDGDHHDDDHDHDHDGDDHHDDDHDHDHDGDDHHDADDHDHDHDGDDHHDADDHDHDHDDHDHDHDGDDHHDADDHDHDGDDHDHDGDDHDHEHDGDDHDHHHDGDDPHVWFDPARVAAMLPELGEAIVGATGLDADSVERCVADYQDELGELDADLVETFAAIPDDLRVLVTSHESLGYLADRYDFDVVGTVIRGTSSMAETNPADLEDLAQAIIAAGVPAVFAGAESSQADIDALAGRAGVDVVVLRTESLGEPGSDTDSYTGLLRTNARLIADALGSPAG